MSDDGGSDQDQFQQTVIRRLLSKHERRTRDRGPEARGIDLMKAAGAVIGMLLSLGLVGVSIEVGAQKEKVRQLEADKAASSANVQRLEEKIDAKARQLEVKIDETDDKVTKILEAVGEIRGELRANRRDRDRERVQ